MTVKFDGAKELAEFLDNYHKTFTNRVKQFEEALSNIYYDQFSITYANPLYAGDCTVTVSKAQKGNTFVVEANGSSILFIEFGTGVFYPSNNPKASEFGFERGGYGKRQGLNDTWLYVGEGGNGGLAWHPNGEEREDRWLTHGNLGANAMYMAEEQVRLQIEKIANEVFGIA